MSTAAPILTPSVQPSAYQRSAGLLESASSGYGDIADGGVLQNINSYLNPYYEQVINSAMGRMDIERDRTLGAIGDSAINAGAFGGSRHGVAEGVFMGQDQLNRAQLEATLNAENHTQASSAARQDMFGSLAGLTQLGNNYYQIGNDISDRNMRQGTMVQNFLQTLLTGGEDRYNEMINQPQQILSLFSALTSSDPRIGNVEATRSSTPGLFDYLSLGAGLGAAKLGAG